MIQTRFSNLIDFPQRVLLNMDHDVGLPLSFVLLFRDEFGPKFFGPGLKWAMNILAWPGHGPKSTLAFGPGRAWAKFKIDGPGWARP